jgi:hypothetical protein
MRGARRVLTDLASVATVVVTLAAAVDTTRPRSSGAAPDERAIENGRRIYQDGILASGTAIPAVVQRDVPVHGAQLSCLSCHRRSGMGASEGSAGVPPVSGPLLYQPRKPPWRARPAYTDDTLARAIREGIDAAGRPLDVLMPRYGLADDDVRSLVAYLKTLSAADSPGVTAEAIHFATVVTPGVDPVGRQAMLDVLDTFFAEKNRETRRETRPAFHAPDPDANKNRAYRKWILRRWSLEGPPATWTEQLEAYYREQPVFAVLSGLGGDWRPVHDFCEAQALPCLLPNTDLPVATGKGFYVRYFSKGLGLEAQAVAEDVARDRAPRRVLQVFERGAPGEAAAESLRAALARHAQLTLFELPVAAGARPSATRLADEVDRAGATVVVLWLARSALAALATQDWKAPAGSRLYLSSSLLDGDLANVPSSLQDGALVAHPFAVPDELPARLRRLEAWLTSRRLALVRPRVQAQTYFACLIANEGLMHIKWYFQRDYLLDVIDHASGIASLAAVYPRVSFGPGQRYLAKGCYILALGTGPDRARVERASWIATGG